MALAKSNKNQMTNGTYDIEDTKALVDLLIGLGCPDSSPLTASGTLPRRRDTVGTPYEKACSGVI